MNKSSLGQEALTGVSDQEMHAKIDAILARGEAMANGEILPETDEDRNQMLWTLLGRVRDQWTPLHKEEMDKIRLNWSNRRFAETRVKFNKPTAKLPDEFPTYEQMLRDLEFIYRTIVPLVH